MLKLATCVLYVFLFSTVSLFSQISRETVGKVSFYFDNGGKMKSPMRVFYYSPKANADDMPIVMMLHGAERDPSNYLNGLMATAEKIGCKIIAPEFDKQDFPDADQYNLGNVYNRNRRKFNPVDEWSFSLIEPLFSHVVSATNSNAKGYLLYGHSAGAQFVHRFLMFVDNPRILKIAIANAGWYTLPDFEEKYPYGIKESPITEKKIESFVGLPLCVFLGTADTDRSSVGFNVTPKAEEQGKTRFERGNYYYNYVKELAEKKKFPFTWQLVHVPDVGHSNDKMGAKALPWLLGIKE